MAESFIRQWHTGITAPNGGSDPILQSSGTDEPSNQEMLARDCRWHRSKDRGPSSDRIVETSKVWLTSDRSVEGSQNQK